MKIATGIFTVFCILASTAVDCPRLAAGEDVVLVNLTNSNVFVHRVRFSNGSSSTSVGNNYTLPAETPAGWSIENYLTLYPGGVAKVDVGSYLLRHRDSVIQIPGLQSEQWFAPRDVMLSGANSGWPAFVSFENRFQDLNQIQRNTNLIPASYQAFKKGLYEIRRSGHDAFFVSQTHQDVEFSGRDRKFIDRSYPIPGQVIDLREEIDSWGAEKFRWTIENKVSDARVRVSGFVEGRQTRPFGPREAGYYRGRVIVRYVQPVAGGSSLPDTNAVPLPRFAMMAHTDESNGRTYVYSISAGHQSRLRITRESNLLHEGVFKGTAQREGEPYFRYQFTFTSDTAPVWALQATRENRYEVWLPADGSGRTVYSADNGHTFVDEALVPPAGRCAPL